MKVAVILQEVSRQAWSDSSLDVLPPIDPYYVTGPRGGRYRAVPPWTRTVDEATRWDKNLITVIDRSAGIRYINPERWRYDLHRAVNRAAGRELLKEGSNGR